MAENQVRDSVTFNILRYVFYTVLSVQCYMYM